MSPGALRRVATLLAAAWFGLGAGLGAVAAPVLFATLDRGSAGRVAARLFAVDAVVGTVLAVVLLMASRIAARSGLARMESPLNAESLLALGGLFCILAGHYAIQPLMVAARGAPPAGPSFAVLHAAAGAFFVAKLGLVAVLAWRWSRPSSPPPSS
ncbi:MAG: DUF4149 domain-containing protein [Pseudomonadota bacterium]|nr:DUF4149 domain-containing protein [Pseudomonadota bacterium]